MRMCLFTGLSGVYIQFKKYFSIIKKDTKSGQKINRIYNWPKYYLVLQTVKSITQKADGIV